MIAVTFSVTNVTGSVTNVTIYLHKVILWIIPSGRRCKTARNGEQNIFIDLTNGIKYGKMIHIYFIDMLKNYWFFISFLA